MKRRVLAISVTVGLVAVVAFAARYEELQVGVVKATTVQALDSATTLTITSPTITGATITGATVSTPVPAAPTALAVTNGQVITVTHGVTYLVTAQGSANALSNIVTFANVAAGTEATFVGAHGMTNFMAAVDGTGRYVKGTTQAIGPDDTWTIYAPSATEIRSKSDSDNS